MVTYSNKEFARRYCKFTEYIISYLKLSYPVDIQLRKPKKDMLAEYDLYRAIDYKVHRIYIYGITMPAKLMRETIAHELRHAFQHEYLGYSWSDLHNRIMWNGKLTKYGRNTNMSSTKLAWERDAYAFELKVPFLYEKSKQKTV